MKAIGLMKRPRSMSLAAAFAVSSWLALTPMPAAAANPTAAEAPPSEVLEARESLLAHHLRCVVCQNQTVAESNAPLAADMRQVIREQLRAGRADDEIVAFFEQRYGAFVRYSPPWQPSTWLLWTGPFLVLIVGLTGLALALRRRGAFDPSLDVDDAREDEPSVDDLLEQGPSR
jgi:cytochrome c-type biogenesis protein CcmH